MAVSISAGDLITELLRSIISLLEHWILINECSKESSSLVGSSGLQYPGQETG